MAKQNKSNNKGNSRPGNNRGSNGRGNNRRKPQYKPKDDSTPDIKDGESSRGDINNPEYYYEDLSVLDQVMNFSFNEFGGVPIDITMEPGDTKTYTNKMIASYWLNPSVPECSNGNQFSMDGAGTAALRNFLKLSGSNAKTTNYAPQDVTILILAIAELIKVQVFCRRAFGVAYLFNYRNRTYPEMLLKAMGIDANDMFDNLADYRVRYNRLLAVASKIPFPADIQLFKKAENLYANIYLDDNDTALAQTYMFCPYSVWLFDEAYDTNGAGLRTRSLVNPNVPVTMNSILSLFESMITALVTSTSLNFIYSDIMRCVQKGYITNLLKFETIAETFYISPVYNTEIRNWIHSAVVVGRPLAAADQYRPLTMQPLTPDNDVSCMAGVNKIFYHPQFELPGVCGYEALVDFDHDQVSVPDKVEATRLAQRWIPITDSGSGKVYTNSLAFGDEYLVEIAFYPDSTHVKEVTSSWKFFTGSENPISTIREADYYSKFDWAPFFYWCYNTEAYPIGDMDYYTLLDYKFCKKVFDYEIIRLLSIG